MFSTKKARYPASGRRSSVVVGGGATGPDFLIGNVSPGSFGGDSFGIFSRMEPELSSRCTDKIDAGSNKVTVTRPQIIPIAQSTGRSMSTRRTSTATRTEADRYQLQMEERDRTMPAARSLPPPIADRKCNGKVLQTNGSTVSAWSAASAGSFSGLADVNLVSLANKQVTQYNSTSGKWENKNAAEMNLTSVANGDLLKYDLATGQWINFVPTYLTSAPTLQQVATAGNTVSANIVVGGMNISASTITNNNASLY
jgi:hypothetical protein